MEIKFKENYTARQYLSQLKAKYRVMIRELLPVIYDAIESPKPFSSSDEILDLPLKDFMSLFKKFTETYGMGGPGFVEDFLG